MHASKFKYPKKNLTKHILKKAWDRLWSLKYLLSGLGHVKMYFNHSHFNISTPTINTNQSHPTSINSIDTAWFIITILILATNLSALLMILCRPNLHIKSNAVLCSMLICGCLLALLYLFPGQVVPQWRKSFIFLCNVIPPSGAAFTSCYNLHLCDICIDKIISLMSPFRHRQILRRRNVIIIISLIWGIPFISNLIPLLTYKPYSWYCNSSWALKYHRVDRIFYTITFIFMVIIPIIITIMLYIITFTIINRRNRIRLLSVSHTRHQISNAGQNLKIIRQMFVVLGLFTLCWMPYFIFFILIYYITSLYLMQWGIRSMYLAYSYVAINPILFAYYTNSIRKEIKGFISQHCRPRKQSFTTKQSTVKNSWNTSR